MRLLYPLLLILLFPFFAFTQSVRDYTVQVHADATSIPSRVILNWPAHTDANSFILTRKQIGATSWGSPIATLSGTDTTYTDVVQPGQEYEYRIRKVATSYDGWGYIRAGIEAGPVEHRGTLILVIDSTFNADLGPKLERLVEDLRGDGWSVIRHDVDRNDTVTYIKDLIRADYNADPTNVKSVFLFGHVTVPYSGNFGNNAPWFAPPDAHSNHGGAWPADVYYGEMDGTWTDLSVTNTTASRSENHNVPGDGKFDQSNLPSNLELAVGRVDFEDMPAFSPSEKDLLEAYLDKDHAYRHKIFTVPEKAVIDDNFGVFNGEIFAANGWRNFAPLIHPNNVSSGDYRTELNASGHIWSYGCGGGSYTSCNGIGNTVDIASDSLQGVFTMLFGSYFGDWDSRNNFLRAPLANKGTVLASAWAGRPHWHFHLMGLGETIGECAKLSQNNQNQYFSSFFYRMPHIALMGDPSLRLHTLAPASNLTVTPVNASSENDLTWSASPDSIQGYNIYRSNDPNGPFLRANEQPITGLSFRDSCPDNGMNYYMVRALRLEEVPSGSYYNLSQGLFGSAQNSVVYPSASFTWTISGDSLYLTNTSTGATTFSWEFGDSTTSMDENPVHGFPNDDTYIVTLIISDGCRADTVEESINFVNREATENSNHLKAYPNPTHDRIRVEFTAKEAEQANLELYSLTGQLVQRATIHRQGNLFKTELDLTGLPNGTYLLRFAAGEQAGSIPVLKQ